VGLTQVSGYPARVHILLYVPDGFDEHAIASEALVRAGAQELGPAMQPQFAVTGFRWRRFLDDNPGNDFVLQSYNPTGQPANHNLYDAFSFFDALRNAQTTWNGIETSTFKLRFGGLTSRCPSMFSQCPGGFQLDGFNDVGWLDLGLSVSPFALAITSTAFETATGFIVESDIALSPKWEWFTGEPPAPPPLVCAAPGSEPPPPPEGDPPPPPEGDPPPPPSDHDPPPPPAFDFETVVLHEDGHLAGLDHSLECKAVMFAFLAPFQVKRALTADDPAGISVLYPLEFVPLPFEPPRPHEYWNLFR
jgi:hypothetical protein